MGHMPGFQLSICQIIERKVQFLAGHRLPLSRFLLRGSTIDDLEELERRIADRRNLEVNALTRIALEIVPDPLWCVTFHLHRLDQGFVQGASKKVLADRGVYRRLSLDQVVNLARGQGNGRGTNGFARARQAA